MADTDSAEVTALAVVGAQLAPGAGVSKEEVNTDTFTIAAQGIGDVLTCQPIPIGARVIGFELLASATMGATATLAIGITGSIAKYRAAAVFTTVGQWVKFMLTGGFGTTLTAVETPILTVAAAALPGAGTLIVRTRYTRH